MAITRKTELVLDRHFDSRSCKHRINGIECGHEYGEFIVTKRKEQAQSH